MIKFDKRIMVKKVATEDFTFGDAHIGVCELDDEGYPYADVLTVHAGDEVWVLRDVVCLQALHVMAYVPKYGYGAPVLGRLVGCEVIDSTS